MIADRQAQSNAGFEAIAMIADARVIPFPIEHRSLADRAKRLPVLQRLSLMGAAAIASWLVVGGLAWGAVDLAQHFAIIA